MLYVSEIMLLIYVRTEGSHLKYVAQGQVFGNFKKKKWIKARKIKAAILYWEGDKLEWSNNVIHSFMSTITVIKTRKAKSYQMSIISIS